MAFFSFLRQNFLLGCQDSTSPDPQVKSNSNQLHNSFMMFPTVCSSSRCIFKSLIFSKAMQKIFFFWLNFFQQPCFIFFVYYFVIFDYRKQFQSITRANWLSLERIRLKIVFLLVKFLNFQPSFAKLFFLCAFRILLYIFDIVSTRFLLYTLTVG